jgi:hypothetical protein
MGAIVAIIMVDMREVELHSRETFSSGALFVQHAI